MTPRLLTTQEAAERLGLTPGSLQELRWKDDGLPIFQNGLSVHYRLEDLEAFEQRELRTLLKQVLQRERPLPLIRAIARSLDLAVNTQGEESNPEVFKPAERQDLKPAPKVKGAAPVPTEQPARALPAKTTAAIDLSLQPNHAWYLVHTKGRQEETALTNLQRQNFRCYMPMLHVEKVRRGKTTVVAEPMFPSYVFVQLDATGNGQSWSPIRSTLGVRELVKFGGHPAKVDTDLITGLHEREQLQQANPKALFAAGDKVVITDGPFAGIEAIYQTTDAERRSMILLSMLNKPVLVEMSEFALYQIHQELQASLAGERVNVNEQVEGDAPEEAKGSDESAIEIVPLLASVCDEVRMQEIMDTWKPQTVYHAAAYKHVPLVEHNPAEGVRNNVWGTRVCAEAAARHGVRNFVLISTDKAVRPTNIMGATKRLAEMVLQALAEVNAAVAAQGGRAPSTKTTFSMVRFGNVLGSSGSVVPLFREQIKNGGPITLTHADITRYFMTIPEAAQLVIQAGAMGQGGDVYVLDMGQPVKIIDLARRMVELSGLTVRDELNPSGDIELTVTGLRPGEKLYEELLIGDNPKPTQHPRIMKAHEQYLNWAQLEGKLNALSMAISVNDVPVIRALLKDLVSGYQPSGEVVDWVHMALEREALANE